MSKFSLTYGAFIAYVLISVLKQADITLNESEIVTTIEVIAQIVTGIGVFWGRYRAGGISIGGFRKV
jgi:uncharacterized membrane protein